MHFYRVRDEIMQGKNISNLSLRVTFYARVSTESDEQLNSLENQILYFENYIKQNENWVYVPGYIDEGISGSTVKKRKNFLKMIADAKEGYFDLIITKEVSRFSRNLSDSIKYTQELMINNVGVYFQTNGINTYDPNSEFILNMMGSVAQEEVKRLSTRVKWGHKNAMARGRILGSSSITGYIKDNGKLVIVEEEAKKIQKIFELYATGRYGFYKLAMELHNMGFNNYKGNIYDKDTLKRIIENPKYKGFYRGHTTEIIDYKTKQRMYIPKEEQLIFKDASIPQIVSEELWDKANEILNNRSNLIKISKGNAKIIERKYCYTARLFCKDHNTSYQRIYNKKRNNNPRWACGHYVRYRIQACESPIIMELDLNNIFRKVLNKIFQHTKSIVTEMKDYYTNLELTDNFEYELNKINIKKELINAKKEKILELNMNGNLSNIEFQEKNEKYNVDITYLNIQIGKLEQEKMLTMVNNYNLNKIENAIKKQLTFRNNISEVINAFLEKVIISKINGNRHSIKIDIYLNLIDNTIMKERKTECINEDTYLLLFSDCIDTLCLGKKQVKKNVFEYNVYVKS